VLIGQGIEVCLVEDDEDLRNVTLQALEGMGFRLRGFPDARSLYLGLLQAPCQILVLDLGLPDEDGLSVVRQLRDLKPLGILVLTSRSGTEDQVSCLLEGADSYMVKPVDFRQLAANIVSLHRRLSSGPAGDEPGARRYAWSLRDEAWTLAAPNGRRVDLTASERILLQRLFDTINAPLSRSDLIQALGHDTEYYLDHRLDMLISRLRRKVRETIGLPLPLKAVRSVGFVLTLSEGSAQARDS
jgi:DNA-binding response OmpR family regulator